MGDGAGTDDGLEAFPQLWRRALVFVAHSDAADDGGAGRVTFEVMAH